jgi:lipopolysaccharide biosynthesis glycosyltransferase
MPDAVHIALAIHDPTGNYCCHIGATLASVLCRASNPVCAHIFHDDALSSDNKDKLQAVAQRWRQEIRFYKIDLPETVNLLGGHWTKGALYRCLLPDLVDASKIIYLDWDIIVNMDIRELWDIDLRDHPLAAALDPAIPRFSSDNHLQIFQKNGIPLHNYFNSGVLVLNLNCLRQNYHLFQQVTDFLQSCPGCLCPDQDALNRLFSNEYLQLETRFNKFTYYQETDCELPAIWHITGPGGKAWECYATPMHILYWKALAQTPWKDTLLDRMSEVMDRTMIKVRKSVDKHRKIHQDLVENLMIEIDTLNSQCTENHRS